MILEQTTGQRFERESRGGLTIEKLIVEPFRRGSTVDPLRLQQTELELARNRAMLAIVTGTMRMPGKRANFDRLAKAVNDPNVTLATLREIAAKLRVATQAAGTQSQHRMLAMPVVTRAAGGNRVITFIASTDGVDRHSTRILPMGLQTDRYERNPLVLFAHDGYGSFFSTPSMENIVGRTVALRKSEKKLEADVEFLAASVNPKAEMLLGMVKAGAVSAMSIGFIPLETAIERDSAGTEIPVITKAELLELSVVPIPSNSEALVSGGRSRSSRN
jgi:HK97 family phage prohead protease